MEALLNGSFFRLVLMFLKWFECFSKTIWFSSSTIGNAVIRKTLQPISSKTELFNKSIHNWGSHGPSAHPLAPTFLLLVQKTSHYSLQIHCLFLSHCKFSDAKITRYLIWLFVGKVTCYSW